MNEFREQGGDQADKWQEEELMSSISRQLDKEDRDERVARGSRKFWAEDMLMESLWIRVKDRKNIKRWPKQIIIAEFMKVISCREILNNLVDDV